jgi:hypothetical protein
MPLNSEQLAQKVDYLRAINQEGMLTGPGFVTL